MRTGALVMLDALGFKGIWKGEAPHKVLERLKRLEAGLNRALDEALGGDRKRAYESGNNVFAHCEATFLSDTIVIALASKTAEEAVRLGNNYIVDETTFAATILHQAAQLVRIVVRGALPPVVLTAPVSSQISPTGWTYRGCISYGQFMVEGNFLVGSAVDSAAEGLEMADGAFIWMTPDALSAFRASITESPSKQVEAGLISYRVPLKGGQRFHTFAVSPFFANEHGDQCEYSVRNPLLSTFSGSLDVLIKKQNTKDFLDTALALIDKRPDWPQGGLTETNEPR